MFLVLISIKKKAGGRFFFFLSFGTFLTFQLNAFSTNYHPPPARDKMEFLRQIIIKRMSDIDLTQVCFILIQADT